MRAYVDVDDLWREEQIRELLVPLKEAVPSLIITCFTIPNKMGPVGKLRVKYPWIVFGIHGFEHSFAECRAWTSDEAEAKIEMALEMGYDPVFKAPNWIMDVETETACRALGVTIHHHADYKSTVRGLRHYPNDLDPDVINVHSHIQRNPVTDYISENSHFEPDYLNKFDTFLTADQLAAKV